MAYNSYLPEHSLYAVKILCCVAQGQSDLVGLFTAHQVLKTYVIQRKLTIFITFMPKKQIKYMVVMKANATFLTGPSWGVIEWLRRMSRGGRTGGIRSRHTRYDKMIKTIFQKNNFNHTL